jgi:hypothetical protein
MNDPTNKSSPKKVNVRNFNALLESCVKTNEKNYRPQVQKKFNNTKTETNNGFQDHNGKAISAAKPLLDCLQPGPLLTSKPYEKSMSQRRRRNKPFNHDDIGTNFFILLNNNIL